MWTKQHIQIAAGILPLFLFTALAKPDKPAYTSWLTGDSTDVKTKHREGIILMGGSTDVDEAHRWMLQNADGGDVVVLRASGKDGYNKYMYGLEKVNSVETILVDSRDIANLEEVARKVRNAEALFIAGGDQGNYVKFWNNTRLSEALNYLIKTKKVTVGGTSAGCAIMGGVYFGALNGSITSEEATADPFHEAVSLGYDDFLHARALKYILTDTHYDARKRIGRHIVFMARALEDRRIPVKGLGVSEKTAVCFSGKQPARVFGSGVAYFLQPYKRPTEKLQKGKPLNWPEAVKSTEVKGTKSGENTFDLKKWKLVAGEAEERIYGVEGGLVTFEIR